MRGLFIAGLVLGAEIGCGALVNLPPEPGDTPAPMSGTDAGMPPPISVGQTPDAGLDASPVEAALALEAALSEAIDAPAAEEREAIDAPAPPSSCPAMPPNLGDPCALPDSGVLRCLYGIAGGSCSTLAYCDGQHWGRGEIIPADAGRCD